MTEEALEALLDNALSGVVASAVIRKIASEVREWALVHLCRSNDTRIGLTEMQAQLEAMRIKCEVLVTQLGG